MSTRHLLIVTAALELAIGVLLLVAPSQAAELLLGVRLDSPAALVVARVAGAALVAIGLSCWLERGPRSALVIGLLTYNVAVPALLVHYAVVEKLHGIALWPGCALHVALAVWCVICLRARRR